MISDKAFDELCCGARAAVYLSWLEAHHAGTPAETDHVFHLMRVGVPALVDRWTPVLARSGAALRVTGVFCHQTPFAHFRLPAASVDTSCELGDLLIVHQHATITGRRINWTRRAVLLQAKMTEDGVCAGRDGRQEYLYSSWPTFVLKGTGPRGSRFRPERRNFRKDWSSGRYALIAKDIHVHARELLFADLPYCCGFPWWIASPLDPPRTAGAEDAGAFIAGMLYDTVQRRGRSAEVVKGPLTLHNTPNNHFDVTVEELLRVTAARTLRSRSGRLTGHRGETGVVCFQQGVLPASVTSPHKFRVTPREYLAERPPKEIVPEDGEEGDGISVLLIETTGEA